MGEAANFTHLWLPHDCSYMRFTNESILKSVDYLLEKRNMSEPSLTIVFLGDSVTKAIVCGIARVLAGSEVYGEIANPVCGGGPFGIVLAHKLTGWINLDFGRLRLTYLFQKSFHARLDHLDWKLEWAITQMKPFAVILNTGAWDFQPEGENPPVKVEGQEHCTSEHTEAISIARADGLVNKTMWEWGIEAQKLNISVYYRNIHFNSRFGALCADERVEKILEGRYVNIIVNPAQMNGPKLLRSVLYSVLVICCPHTHKHSYLHAHISAPFLLFSSSFSCFVP